MNRPSAASQPGAATLTHRILHLTDTHLLGDPAERHHGVDTAKNLEAVLQRVEQVAHIDLVALTGDLSEDGSVASYQRLRAIIEPWARERGAAVAYLMGNHDHRPSFRAVLGSGLHAFPAERKERQGTSAGKGKDHHEVPASDQVDRSAGLREPPLFDLMDLDGLRVAAVDTSVPLRGYGRLEVPQLRQLREALADPRPAGSLLLMHHPPVPAQTELLQALALQNPEDLAQILKATDVRMILSGHYHHALLQQWSISAEHQISVIVGSAVTNQAEAFGDPTEEISYSGASGTLVELYDDGGHRVMPFSAPVSSQNTPVMHLDAATVRSVAKLAGPSA